MTLLLGKGVRTLPKNVLFFTGLILFLSLFTPTGCLNLQKPARYVEQYTLEYPSPEVSGLSSIENSPRSATPGTRWAWRPAPRP